MPHAYPLHLLLESWYRKISGLFWHQVTNCARPSLPMHGTICPFANNTIRYSARAFVAYWGSFATVQLLDFVLFVPSHPTTYTCVGSRSSFSPAIFVLVSIFWA